jgi:hypothetical protein
MSTTSSPRAYKDPGSGWAFGVATFAGVMLVTVAVFQVLEGIAAIAEDDIYVTGIKYAYEIDVTTWGWVHLILGIIGIATGLGLLAGQTWARITGITLAVIAALANFAFIPYYPLWSLLIIGFYVLVIWALTTQMSEA